MHLRPFFSYFGSKWRLARKYGAPQRQLLIEPFAGAAGYATYWGAEEVLLIDHNPTVVETWRYLMTATPADIRALPAVVQCVDDFDLPKGAKNLIGYWLRPSCATPAKTAGKWAVKHAHQCSVWGAPIRERVASQLHALAGWKIQEGKYTQAPDVEAHWFVDPPYRGAGHNYVGGQPDYTALSEWCRRRRGLVQVCEQEGETWLPFAPFARTFGTRRHSVEALWQQES